MSISSTLPVQGSLFDAPPPDPAVLALQALRALAQTDAFPVGDIGILRALARLDGGERLGPKQLLARAEGWRPWRAYAVLHLWTDDAEQRGTSSHVAAQRARRTKQELRAVAS